MRTASFVAGTIVATGIYLLMAAAFAYTPAWIGLGVLAISVTSALAVMVGSGRRGTPSHS